MNLDKILHDAELEKLNKISGKKKKGFGNEFDNLGIASNLLKAINKLKFDTPTPIQKESIPAGIKGDDIIAIAQTGSGKTLAFGIPMLQRLAESKKGTGLILVPTRELALQVDEALQTISRSSNIRSTVIIGGASMNMQRSALKRNPRIIIATPGRLMDHIDRRTVDISNVEVFVLDEADRMLDMGFVPDIKKIMKSIPDSRQTLLFSATMPKEIEAIAKKLMPKPTRFEIDRSGATPADISQEIYILGTHDKRPLLAHHLKQCTGPVLVFNRTRRGAAKLAQKINDMGFTCAEIHSDRSLAQRRHALEGFKRGRYQVLIATDIAARGIDVKGIELVVNYDMPANSEDYVHRIGRTGRAGKEGHAVTYATRAQKGYIKTLERFMKTTITISALPKLPTEKQLLKDGEQFKDINSALKREKRPSARKSYGDDRPEKRRSFREERPERKRAAKDDRNDKRKSYRDERPERKRAAKDDKPYRGKSSRDERPERKRAARDDRNDKRKSYGDERPERNRAARDDKPYRGKSSSDRYPRRSDGSSKSNNQNAINRIESKQLRFRKDSSSDSRPERRSDSRDGRPVRRKDSRSDRPTNRTSFKDRSSSNRPDFKKRDDNKYGKKRPDSKHVRFNNDNSRNDRPDQRRDDRPDRRRDDRPFRKRDSRDERPTNRPSYKDRSSSNRPDFKKRDDNNTGKKWSDSKPGFKRDSNWSESKPEFKRDSNRPGSKSKSTKPKFAQPFDKDKTESNKETPFWSKFKKKKPSKKKSLGKKGKKKNKK